MFEAIPVGAMVKLFVPIIILGSLVDIAVKPHKPEQCTNYVSGKSLVENVCLPGTSDLHLTSSLHSPATIVTSQPVKIIGYPSFYRGFPKSPQVFVIPDATDLTLRISSTKSFTETITFARSSYPPVH